MMTRTLAQSIAQRTDDFTGAVNEALVAVGEKFELYEAIAQIGPTTADELAASTGIATEKIAPWLKQQASADYLYSDEAGRFHVACPLADRN